MTDKEAQLKAKLLKMKLAEQKKWSATGLSPEEIQKVRADHEKRRKYMKLDPTKNKNKVTESDFHSGNFEIKDAKGKINKLKKKYVDPNPQAETPEEIMQSAESAGREPSYIAQEHGHRIAFRGHPAGNYKTASLNEQSGKYAKYWLLNAKETNGNGWGIAAHTAKDNMKKFIGRPLVVTASSWHGASEYGDEYEHPYLPTNDITKILNHQEKFRVGSIVDVFEDKHGDWYASIEMLPKFASSRLPPFCSPAIYQLDASEAEGQISKWEALHLAALTENPAYGARIALLKGTCVGTGSECKVQFKSAKQEATTVCPKKKQKISRLKQRLAYQGSMFNPDSKYDRQITNLSKNFESQRNEITKRRPDDLVPRQPKNAFGHVCTNEATCGATSGFLRNKLIADHGLNFKQVKVEGGMYTGPGGEFASGAFRDNDGTPTVGHEWIRLDDGTIIDGSVGQFMNQKNKINQKQRLRIIPPDGPLQRFYRGHYERSPLNSRKWYDKNDPLKKSVEKYQRIMRKGKEDPTEKVIREVKDPEKKKDLLNRLDEKPNEYGPKNYGTTKRKDFGKKIAKLKQRIASPIIQETGEGINYKIVTPKQPLEGRTYGYHKVPMHPSNTILIRPNKIENQMPLIKHFRNIQHRELPRYVQGSVQQSLRTRDLSGLSSPFGGRLKDHAKITRGMNQELKKGDILMRRVGGKPGDPTAYGQVGDTFYITEDSPKGELFKYESKYKRNPASPLHKSSKLKSKLAEKKTPSTDDLVDKLTNIIMKEKRENALSSPKAGSPENQRSDPTTPLIKEVPFGPDTRRIENLEHGNEKNYDIPSHNMTDFDKFEAEQKKLPVDKQFPLHKKGFRVIPHGGISIPAEQKRKEIPFEKRDWSKGKLKSRSNRNLDKSIDAKGIVQDIMFDEKPNRFVNRKTKKIRPPKPVRSDYASIITAKLKARLASLGEQNMTYQNSKKVRIHKKKNMEKHDKS